MLIDAAEVRRLAAKVRERAPRQYARGGPVRGASHWIDTFDVAPAVPYDGPIMPLMSPYEVVPFTDSGGKALCPHRQAEPVILSTEETVACVCIACLDSLPADWITNQRDRAEREARCTHEQTWDDRRFGSPKARRHCNGCGATWEV